MAQHVREWKAVDVKPFNLRSHACQDFSLHRRSFQQENFVSRNVVEDEIGNAQSRGRAIALQRRCSCCVVPTNSYTCTVQIHGRQELREMCQPQCNPWASSPDFIDLSWVTLTERKLEMWANAQRDGRPAKCRALCSTPQSSADAHY